MAIDINPYTKIISITSPQDDVLIQNLVNAIRAFEDSGEAMAFDKIIDAVGKAELGESVVTGITMALSSTWQIQFWSGVGMGVVRGGNLVGGVGGEPILPTGGNDTIKVIQEMGGVIAETGVSGLTQEESDKLIGLPSSGEIVNGIWDELLSAHMGSGSFGEAIAFISDIEGGKWRIVNNQMIFYKADNVTEVARFNLYDISGSAAMEDIYERRRV